MDGLWALEVAVEAWARDREGLLAAISTQNVLPDGQWEGSKEIRFYCSAKDGSALRIEYRPDLDEALPWWLVVRCGAQEGYDKRLATVEACFESLLQVRAEMHRITSN